MKNNIHKNPCLFVAKTRRVSRQAGLGISSMRWNEIIGQVAQKDYQADELI